MCEHLRMDPKDDPEARIRELERPLADAARTSELGTGVSAGPQPWTHSNSFPATTPGTTGTPWPGYEPYPAAPQPQRRSNGAPLFLMFGVLALALLVGGLVTAYLTFGGSETAGTDTRHDHRQPVDHHPADHHRRRAVPRTGWADDRFRPERR